MPALASHQSLLQPVAACSAPSCFVGTFDELGPSLGCNLGYVLVLCGWREGSCAMLLQLLRFACSCDKVVYP